MKNYYTKEVNAQMLIYLLKKHNIKKVVASPGATNITFVASLQIDPFFEIYSAVDERSAAYMACGIAAESGEPVVLTCTGATASRNYISGLTEAYYRKLPVLAVTSTQFTGRIGNLVPQVIDRFQIQKDIAVMSVDIPIPHNKEEKWDCNTKLNKALLALKHRGGGPVHINLATSYTKDFSVKKLPSCRVIERITLEDEMPKLKGNKIAIFVGAHAEWSKELTQAVDEFCEKYNAVVLCDHTSNYTGKYGVLFNLVGGQFVHWTLFMIDVLIDIGEVSGAYMFLKPKKVWRVNSDGEIRDRFHTLSHVFEMSELAFFKKINQMTENNKKMLSNFEKYKSVDTKVRSCIPELPFSNAWVAKTTTPLLPKDSVLHLGILNTLRCWNLFETDKSISCYCNTGGFGIDGLVSTLIGSALVNPQKLHFVVVGDLAFFYDLNSVANKNVGNNVRILLINNGCGTEFKNYTHFATRFVGDTDSFISAKGHNGNQSRELVKHYAQDLGFEYLSANNKEEFNKNVKRFVEPKILNKPILFEVFTDSKDESDALKLMNFISLKHIPKTMMTKRIKQKQEEIIEE